MELARRCSSLFITEIPLGKSFSRSCESASSWLAVPMTAISKRSWCIIDYFVLLIQSGRGNAWNWKGNDHTRSRKLGSWLEMILEKVTTTDRWLTTGRTLFPSATWSTTSHKCKLASDIPLLVKNQETRESCSISNFIHSKNECMETWVKNPTKYWKFIEINNSIRLWWIYISVKRRKSISVECYNAM